MERLLFIVFIAYVIQTFMVYLQMKHVRENIKELRTKGLIGIGTKKRKLMAGSVVILVSNQFGKIIEARTMQGISVLARFKKNENVCGLSLHELREQILNSKEKKPAMLEALNQLETHMIQ